MADLPMGWATVVAALLVTIGTIYSTFRRARKVSPPPPADEYDRRSAVDQDTIAALRRELARVRREHEACRAELSDERARATALELTVQRLRGRLRRAGVEED